MKRNVHQTRMAPPCAPIPAYLTARPLLRHVCAFLQQEVPTCGLFWRGPARYTPKVQQVRQHVPSRGDHLFCVATEVCCASSVLLTPCVPKRAVRSRHRYGNGNVMVPGMSTLRARNPMLTNGGTTQVNKCRGCASQAIEAQQEFVHRRRYVHQTQNAFTHGGVL